eukprot:gene15787-21381_t
MTDVEIKEIIDIALGEGFKVELNKKVESAMQDEWDREQGVNTAFRRKQKPLQANLDVMNFHAKTEFYKGNFTGALKLYQRSIDYDATDGRAWLGTARVHWKRGSLELAEKSYKDGLYYNPKNPFLLQSYADMLIKIGQQEEAQKMLITSVKSNPSHAASWVSLAYIHSKNGDIGSARYCYASAAEGDPKSYVALQAWGSLEANIGNVDKARELFSEAVLVSQNKSIHSYQAWATLERKQGNLDE